jgi:hypothetical protein
MAADVEALPGDVSACQPNGRLIDPNEVAWAVALLACDNSGVMTGPVVNFDQSIWGATIPPRSQRWR